MMRKVNTNHGIIVFLLILMVIISGCGDSSANKVEVSVADLSNMSRDEIRSWCDANNIECSFEEEYSDTSSKGSFISQSVGPNGVLYEGDTIRVVYSLGKEPSNEMKNALAKAEQYSSMMHMSKRSIYDQLTSEYGEQFTEEAAQYAIDNMTADWNANALEKAKTYQQDMSMSKQAIYDQLVSPYGEQFTKEQAQYAVDHLDD